MADLVHIHIESGACEREDCDLTGFHFHWRGKVYRSAFDGTLTPDEAIEFDTDCMTDHLAREAARHG